MEIFPGINTIDDSPDWDAVNRVPENSETYREEVRAALTQAANDPRFDGLRDFSVPVLSSIEVGRVFTYEPDLSINEAINEIKRRYLRELEIAGLVRKLGFEDVASEDPNWFFLIADFSFVPSQIISKLPKLADRRRKTSIEKKLERQQERHFPHRIPRGTRWENIYIIFKDTENVTIKTHNFTHETDFRKMGFKGRGKDEPSKQWLLLLLLSQNGGELTWKTIGADFRNKKRLELLNNEIKEYFRDVAEDPFSGYRRGYGYKAKLVLSPPIQEVFSKNVLPDLHTENEESFYEQEMENYS